MNGNKSLQSRWGTSRFGGSSATLVWASLVAGAVVATGIALAFTNLRQGDDPLLTFIVMAACTMPIASTLGWVALVDRTTILGATKSPADSIEAAWYDKAASGAFLDIICVSGLGAGVFAVANFNVRSEVLLGAIFLIAAASFAARYLWHKKATS